jgi:uncharacterized glyoxalase superfamily protein PhnB
VTALRSNRSIPSAFVIPTLAYPDVREAADWLCRAFGFRVRLRIGDHRIQLVCGDGAVVVTQGEGGSEGHGVLVRVEDADAHRALAAAAGARILDEPTDRPYGERQYTAEDIGGHRWTFSQSIADVDPASGAESSSSPRRVRPRA